MLKLAFVRYKEATSILRKLAHGDAKSEYARHFILHRSTKRMFNGIKSFANAHKLAR